MKKPDKSPSMEPMGSDEAGETPQYPYGLCITLNEASIAALGLSKLPVVGEKLNIKAMVEVQSISQYDATGGKKDRSISLQITDMEIVKKNAVVDANAMYPKETTVKQGE